MREQKLALVTGARRGIGLGIAKALAQSGYYVVLSAASPEAEQALAQLRPLGEAEYIPCDISDAGQRQALFDGVLSRHGRLDVLVNNAGVAPAQRLDILSTTEENFSRVLDVNLKGGFFMCQAGARAMIGLLDKGIEGYSPRIVNISSISAYTASVNRGEYCISKAGVSMTTQLFAARLAEYGIPVFEVRPGIIDTDMIGSVRERYQNLIQEGLLPTQRLGTPQDVAGCVLAACSGLLDYGTGQVLNADGGFHLRRL